MNDKPKSLTKLFTDLMITLHGHRDERMEVKTDLQFEIVNWIQGSVAV